jgi:hypothetical protein
MSMPSVVYSREVPLAAQSLHEAIGAVLESFAARSLTDAVVLSSPIGTSSSQVSVPVELSITQRSTKNSPIGVTIKARSAGALFPSFNGAFDALAMAPARTNLRLKGTYTVPLGPLGSTINAAGLHKMAEDSLRDLFERVVDETVEAVRKDSTRRFNQGHATS